MLKNTTHGYTEAWKRERQRILDFIKNTPYYGGPLAEKFHGIISKVANVLQSSVCGSIVSVVCYKQDVDKVRHVLYQSFKVPPKERTCDYTQLVTVYLFMDANKLNNDN